MLTIARPGAARRLLFGLLPLLPLLLSACREERAALERLDDGSRRRLTALADDERVLVSLTAASAVAPEAEEAVGRIIDRVGRSRLFDVPRADVARSVTMHDGHPVVWGASTLLGRLDPGLRREILRRFDAGDSSEVAAIALFTVASPDLAGLLRGAGAEPGSITGTVATLTAPPDGLLDVLALPELKGLSKPRIQSIH